MNNFIPCISQQEILKYRGGRLGIAAVPGASKTHILATRKPINRQEREERQEKRKEFIMTADIEAIAKDIVDAAYKVHKEFGPGLLESAYQACHVYELRKRGRIVQPELTLPIEYDGQEFDEGYRIDELVDGLVIVENKAIDEVHPIHMAQLITYLKLKNCRLGFLINWNVKLIKNGVQFFIAKFAKNANITN